MVILFSKELPSAAALFHFKGIKLGGIFLSDPFNSGLHLVQGYFFLHEAEGIIDQFGQFQGSQGLVAGKDQRFNMWYQIGDFHLVRSNVWVEINITVGKDETHLLTFTGYR